MSFILMDYKKLSIKNFIGDLPNIVNSNFEIIKNLINKIFSAETNTITVTNVKASSKIIANSVTTNNLTVVDNSGKRIAFSDIIQRIEALENAAN